MAVHQQYGSTSAIWQYNSNMAVHPAIWQYDSNIAVHQQYGSATALWQYNSNMAVHQQYGSTTAIWQYNSNMAVHQQYGSTSAIWQYISYLHACKKCDFVRRKTLYNIFSELGTTMKPARLIKMSLIKPKVKSGQAKVCVRQF
jgi:hypothetical protein